MVGYSSNYPFLGRLWARFYKEMDHVTAPKIPPGTSVGCESLPLKNNHNCWDTFWSADADVTVRLWWFTTDLQTNGEMTEWAKSRPATWWVKRGFRSCKTKPKSPKKQHVVNLVFAKPPPSPKKNSPFHVSLAAKWRGVKPKVESSASTLTSWWWDHRIRDDYKPMTSDNKKK